MALPEAPVLPEHDATENSPIPASSSPKRRPLRPEWIMAIIAACAAVLLAVVQMLVQMPLPVPS